MPEPLRQRGPAPCAPRDMGPTMGPIGKSPCTRWKTRRRVVEAVISEPVSRPTESLIYGKMQGILSASERIGPSCCRYASVFAGEVEQIPNLQEQGIFTAKQGTSTREQGVETHCSGP